MEFLYRGKEDEVWQTALEIEKNRLRKREEQKEKRRKRSLAGVKIDRKTQKDEAKRRNDRAKVLTNDGELSKAFATMVQRGVAPPTENILSQLRSKFPKRKNQVCWPNKDKIEKLRNLVEKIVIEMDVDECKDKTESASHKIESLIPDSVMELKKSVDNDFQAV